jgi:Mn2+/Fe2+ NRAMP family transporter
MLGPGLVTGASDDDPSGIGTYSQVGAQFGYGLLWTMLISYPLMAAIQEISARIGGVTGCGICGESPRKLSQTAGPYRKLDLSKKGESKSSCRKLMTRFAGP